MAAFALYLAIGAGAVILLGGWRARRAMADVDTGARSGSASEQPRELRLASDRWCDFAIVGESFHQDALEAICAPTPREGAQHHCRAILRPEPENPHDSHAVAVYVGDRRVGYLKRRDAIEYRMRMRDHGLEGRDASCTAYISGGWRRGRDRGDFGVRLGLRWPPEPET